MINHYEVISTVTRSRDVLNFRLHCIRSYAAKLIPAPPISALDAKLEGAM
jgi:hypothetical protein